MTIGNGPAGGGGHATLTYSIENVRHDEICQNEDTVALTEGSELRSVFFSDKGVRAKEYNRNAGGELITDTKSIGSMHIRLHRRSSSPTALA